MAHLVKVTGTQLTYDRITRLKHSVNKLNSHKAQLHQAQLT